MDNNAPAIRVGTAGWHYKDWYGNVYPENPPAGFKELDYIAGLFHTAEINATFYKPSNSFMAAAWARKISMNPDFKLTAKLWQRFTHDTAEAGKEDAALYYDGIRPLAESGRLGAVLIQFPWRFRNTDASRLRLSRIIDTFHDLPLVVEVRHASWDVDAFYSYLDDHGIGFASIDQPVIGQSIAFKPVRTGTIGYVRLHGRNYTDWFPKKESRKPAFARYDYLYNEKEIEEIAENIKTVAEGSHETYVIQNNHPRGQAAANAMQIRAALGETILNLPESLIRHFPVLKKLLNKQPPP